MKKLQLKFLELVIFRPDERVHKWTELSAGNRSFKEVGVVATAKDSVESAEESSFDPLRKARDSFVAQA